jgi:hypothetical protein
MQHISTADVDIISMHNLVLAKKSLMKTELLLTQNHQCDIFLWLMLKSLTKSMLLPIQKLAVMIKSFMVLHLPTPAYYHISHKYNHNHNSQSHMSIHQTNKIEALYSVIHVSAAACFQGLLITQFVEYVEFTSLTYVQFLFQFHMIKQL